VSKTHIPYGHIQLLRWGCPDLNVKVKVRRRSKTKYFIIPILSSTNTITMFVFRKVTWDVYGCKTLFICCTLYNMHKFKMATNLQKLIIIISIAARVYYNIGYRYVVHIYIHRGSNTLTLTAYWKKISIHKAILKKINCPYSSVVPQWGWPDRRCAAGLLKGF